MSRKRKRARWVYGARLGAWLTTQIEGAANQMLVAQSGETPTPEQVEEAADAIRERIVEQAGLSGVESLLSIESGASNPTDEQADAIAAVMSEMEIPVTGDEIRDMRDEEDETVEEEARADDPAHNRGRRAADPNEDDDMKFKARAEQAEKRVAELERELAEAREQATANEPLVEAGEQQLKARRTALLRRVALARNVEVDKLPESYRKRVEAAAGEELVAFEETAGVDPITTPLCAQCGTAAAAQYRSSHERIGKDGQPEAMGGEVDRNDRNVIRDAAKAYQRANDGVSFAAAAKLVQRLPDSEFTRLAHEGGPTSLRPVV